MSSIKLSRSFPNPQHMRRLAIVLPMMLSCQSSLIRQNQAFMRNKHFVHVLKKIIVCDCSVEVSITKFTVLRVAVLYINIIYVVSFVIVDLFAIVYHKFRSSGFCVLASDSSDYHCLFRAR